MHEITAESLILFGLVGYIFVHLVIHDILAIFERCRVPIVSNRCDRHHNEHFENDFDVMENQNIVKPFEINMLTTQPPESNRINYPKQFQIPSYFFITRRRNDSIVVAIFNKICDVVLICVLGYFHTFVQIWVACLNCLELLLGKYINFLTDLVKTLTSDGVIQYFCASAIVLLIVVALIIYILLPNIFF